MVRIGNCTFRVEARIGLSALRRGFTLGLFDGTPPLLRTCSPTDPIPAEPIPACVVVLFQLIHGCMAAQQHAT